MVQEYHTESKDVAGLKIVPRGVADVADGFKTDKGTLESMLPSLSGVARVVTLYIRYSAYELI